MEFTEDMVYNALGLERENGEDKEDNNVSDGTLEENTAKDTNKDTEESEEAADTFLDENEKEEEEPDKKEALTEDERNRNAARRRKYEEEERTKRAVEAAVNAEKERASAELADFFERANLKNTMTGEVIKSLDEFNLWKTEYEQKKLQREIDDGNFTVETLNRVIAENADIKAAKEIIEREKSQREAEEKEAADRKIKEEIEEIHKLDSSINSVSDLLSMEGADTFRDYVKKGNSFIDAFYLTRRESLINKKAEEATRQKMANIASKGHLKATGTARGAGAPSVPREEMEIFKLFNPTASESDINAYYSKQKKD